MIVGVTLFVQVARAIFVPSKKLSKISIECHNCSLLQHDVDAVHCKHCGNLLKIAMENPRSPKSKLAKQSFVNVDIHL